METRILSILTRTPLHVGAGASVGVIDLPVQRERHTQIPIIPGSSLKGVLRDLWNDVDEGEQRRLFGSSPAAAELEAGALLVGEARAVCFPVRSAKGSFAWLTCPLVLRRYLRECGREGAIELRDPRDDEHAFAGEMVLMKDSVVLEEYCFKAEALPQSLFDVFKDYIPGDPLLQTLPRRLVLVSDGIYSHFCANACEVQQRIQIEDETHTVKKGALFNQENVPSDTLFYAVIADRRADGCLDRLAERLAEVGGVLQIGGDETVGLGYCSVYLRPGESR